MAYSSPGVSRGDYARHCIQRGWLSRSLNEARTRVAQWPEWKRRLSMADWQTVRYDPTYVEPLDPEIIPLCDALNAAGFVTTSSCCGHGFAWPHVWFEHSTDERIERLARFVLATEVGDFRPYFSMWQKEIRLDGYAWDVEIHLNNAYRDTPIEQALAMAVDAIGKVAAAVAAWHDTESKQRIVGERWVTADRPDGPEAAQFERAWYVYQREMREWRAGGKMGPPPPRPVAPHTPGWFIPTDSPTGLFGEGSRGANAPGDNQNEHSL